MGQLNFAGGLNVTVSQISTANTNRDGTGTVGTIATGGTSGSRIENIQFKATGTTTAGMIRLYLYNGTNTRMVDEVPVTAITPSGTVAAWSYFYPCGWLWLPTSAYELRASTHNAETFNVHVFAGNF